MTADLSGPMALAIDDLLTEAPPEVRAALVDAVPPQLRRRIEGVSHDLVAGMSALGSPQAVGPREVPPWVRLCVLETWSRWALGTADTCMHAPRIERAEPVSAAAWRPGVVACGQCSHLLTLPRGSAADRRCDGCGRVTAGPEHGDGIRPCVLKVATMLYLLGACERCTW